MKYPFTSFVPQDKRQTTNTQILTQIQSGDWQELNPQEVYNSYTGKGGLHGLKREDYPNYTSFSKAKKLREQGQFFTPPAICQMIIDSLRPDPHELVCDPAMGIGHFFNHLSGEARLYGNEIDGNAVDVAKFLYPEANISKGDMSYYEPGIKFDWVIGNPPFNLRLFYYGRIMNSQMIFCRKAAEILKPGGILAFVVPASFLADDFHDKNRIEFMNDNFSFLAQQKLKSNAFKPFGVESFDTKIMIFQRNFPQIEARPFIHDRYISLSPESIYNGFVQPAREEAKKQKSQITLQLNRVGDEHKAERERIKKLLFDIKAHPKTKQYYAKAFALVEKFQTQERPHSMNQKEWAKRKLTWPKVISRLKQYLKKQNYQPQEKIRLVRTQYGIKYKAYSRKAQTQLNKTTSIQEWKITDLIRDFHKLPIQIQKSSYFKSIQKKHTLVQNHAKDLTKLAACPTMARALQQIKVYKNRNEIGNTLSLFDQPKEEYFTLNQYQAEDLSRILSNKRKYAFLAYQMGCGKTGMGYIWQMHQPSKFTIIIAPAIAVTRTWEPFLKNQQADFITIKTRADLLKLNGETERGREKSSKRQSKYSLGKADINNDVEDMWLAMERTSADGSSRGPWLGPFRFFGQVFSKKSCITISKKGTNRKENKASKILLISISRINILKKPLMKFMKQNNQNISLVFDESDEITNYRTRRTQAILAVFRRAKYKLLMTGTATRNNINELYPQLELLYNNSANMLCEVEEYHIMGRDKELEEKQNPYYNQPFPAHRGQTIFMRCFSPRKASVFGIEKDTQDVYNLDTLLRLINRTRISRTFAEVVGPDKYSIHRHSCEFSQSEAELYRKLVEEFFKFKDYFESTGNKRKDAGLQAIRQLKLLIEGCCHPHLFPDFEGTGHAQKFQKVKSLLREFQGEKVAIGILRKKVFGKDYLAHWVNYLSDLDRQIFVISGETSFSKRGKIIEAFQESQDGILLSTQGSLKSSVNIPACNRVILPCLNWNMPKLAQYYFRFIRMDMKTPTQVHFVTYANSIEENLWGLLINKERLNAIVKNGEYADSESLMEFLNLDEGLFDSLLRKEYDHEGKVKVNWSQKIMA